VCAAGEAAAQLRAPHPALTVSTTISFASLWLIPRLADFRRANPQIDIRVAPRCPAAGDLPRSARATPGKGSCNRHCAATRKVTIA